MISYGISAIYMLLVSDFVYSSLLNIKMFTQCRVLALALVLDDCFKYSKNLLVKKIL